MEAIFSDEKEGRCQLVVSPLFRLVSKANATLRDVGPPEGVAASIGNFITGESGRAVCCPGGGGRGLPLPSVPTHFPGKAGYACCQVGGAGAVAGL